MQPSSRSSRDRRGARANSRRHSRPMLPASSRAESSIRRTCRTSFAAQDGYCTIRIDEPVTPLASTGPSGKHWARQASTAPGRRPRVRRPLHVRVWLHGRIFRARETGARRAVVSVRSVRVRTLSDQGDGRYSGRRAEKLPGLDRADTIIIPGWRRRRPAPTRTAANATPRLRARRAALASMSVRTLQRQFRETVGLSPREWIVRERIVLAKDLLEDGRVRLDQIAARVGFRSEESFRRHFRRLVGTSPSAYRQPNGRASRSGAVSRTRIAETHRVSCEPRAGASG